MTGNNARSNVYGIYVYFYSNNNTVTGNNVITNNYLGISLRYFHSNKIYLNKKSIYLDYIVCNMSGILSIRI
ncbi:MAG: hypothetical protein KAT65_09270, partial [Methanophagales archaeon]|nr:hypothetical protein [Methanophagales archaeon]